MFFFQTLFQTSKFFPDACPVHASPRAQVADTLEVLRQRLAGLGLEGGALHMSRMLRQHSRPVAIKKVRGEGGGSGYGKRVEEVAGNVVGEAG